MGRLLVVRSLNEGIFIGDNIHVKLVKQRGKRSTWLVTAPDDITILRDELTVEPLAPPSIKSFRQDRKEQAKPKIDLQMQAKDGSAPSPWEITEALRVKLGDPEGSVVGMCCVSKEGCCQTDIPDDYYGPGVYSVWFSPSDSDKPVVSVNVEVAS